MEEKKEKKEKEEEEEREKEGEEEEEEGPQKAFSKPSVTHDLCATPLQQSPICTLFPVSTITCGSIVKFSYFFILIV